jgi:hypothetical protein
MSRSFLVLAIVLLASPGCAGGRGAVRSVSPVRVQFVAQGDSFTTAVREYEGLWVAEGARIVEAMERVSGLTFVSPVYADTAITAQVLERASSSGYRTSPMQMRASYPLDTRRATLIHELGHRLQGDLFRREEDHHGPLFLWIYDVWTDLYGREFADAQVIVERRRGGPYPAAWDAAMALSRSERAARWKALRDERMATRR